MSRSFTYRQEGYINNPASFTEKVSEDTEKNILSNGDDNYLSR